MGFRLSLASTLTSYQGQNLAINPGTDSYDYWKDFSVAHGWIIPQLSWGMARNLFAQGIRPIVTVDWGFARNFQRGVYYNTAGEHIEYSKNYMEPVITFVLNGYNFYKSDNGWTFSVDGDYMYTNRIFKNDYSVPDPSGFRLQTKTINGFFDPDTSRDINFNEYNYSSHQIRLWTTFSYGEDNLELRARFYFPVTLRTERDAPMVLKSDGSGDFINAAGRYNQAYALIFPEKDIFDITFSPFIEMAARYKLISGVLNLNLGGKFQQTGIGRTTTSYTQYSHPDASSSGVNPNINPVKPDGGSIAKEDKDASFTVSTIKYGSFISEFRAGLTWYLSNNIALDAATGIRQGKDLSLTGTTGSLTNFGSILIMAIF